MFRGVLRFFIASFWAAYLTSAVWNSADEALPFVLMDLNVWSTQCNELAQIKASHSYQWLHIDCIGLCSGLLWHNSALYGFSSLTVDELADWWLISVIPRCSLKTSVYVFLLHRHVCARKSLSTFGLCNMLINVEKLVHFVSLGFCWNGESWIHTHTHTQRNPSISTLFWMQETFFKNVFIKKRLLL